MTNEHLEPGAGASSMEALASVVERFGPAVGDDPRRVRAGINDLLGSAARSRRAEVDAIVVAAEESIPEGLAAGDLDRDTALERVRARGLSDDSGEFAVAVWARVLGVDSDDDGGADVVAGLPLLTISTPEPELGSGDPSIPDDVAPVLVAAGGVDVGSADRPAGTMPAAPDTGDIAALPLTPAAEELAVLDDESAPRRGRTVLLLGAGAVAILIIVGAVALLVPGGDDRDAPRPIASSKKTAPAAVLALEKETTDWGAEVARDWKVDDGTFSSSVTLTNPGDAPIAGRHVEVVPKSLAATVDLITFTPEPDEVIEKDPMVAWDLRLEPGTSTEIEYVVEDLDEDAGLAELKGWSKDRDAAIAAAKPKVDTALEDTTGPPINLLYPGANSTVGEPAVTVLGATEADAKLVVNGTPATVNAEGGFSAQISLQPGANKISVSATDPTGNENLVEITVNHVPGSTGTSGGGSSGGGSSGGGGTGGGSTGGGGTGGGSTGGGGTGGGSTGGGGTGGGTTGGGTTGGETVKPPPPDGDGDGFIDSADRCPSDRGIAAHGGCPAPTLTVYGPSYVCPYPAEHSYEVGWTGSLTPSSYRWYADNGTQYTGGKTVSGLWFNPGRSHFTVAVTFDGVTYSQRTYVDAAAGC